VNDVRGFEEDKKLGIDDIRAPEEEKPKTLWDMFIDYVKTKEKGEDRKFVEVV